MKQINFRLSEEEFTIVTQIAAILGKSVPTFLKELTLKEIASIRFKVALDLYAQKKLGLKRAWTMSGLSFFEFQQAIIAANIEPSIPEELEDKMINLALSLRKEDIFQTKIDQKGGTKL